MNKKILILDDNNETLKKYKATFKDSKYDYSLFHDFEEVMLTLIKENFDIVIIDANVKNIDCFELLFRIKTRQPNAIRIISGTTNNSRKLFQAVEENIAKVFITKPFNKTTLLRELDHLMEMMDFITSDDLKDIVNSLSDIPTLPHIYNKINKMIIANEDVEKISEVIESDQAIASKILRIANSAFHGLRTGSIQQASMYIGLTSVKNIILSSSIFIVTKGVENIIDELWENSMLTNKFTALIYKEFLGKKINNTNASAGLLHNIGVAAFLRQKSSEYGKCLLDNNLCKSDLVRIEEEMFGIDHQILGAYLLNWWEMPHSIVEAAMFHSTPLDIGVINKELLAVIHLAGKLAWKQTGRIKDVNEDGSYFDECCKFLSIDKEQVIEYFNKKR